jgi:hypothetical protein
LVNEEDVLGNITNRTLRRERLEKQEKDKIGMSTIEEEESSQQWEEENHYKG